MSIISDYGGVRSVCFLSGLVLAACLAIWSNWPGQRVTGYLPDGSLNIVATLPPAPLAGSAAAQADEAVFLSTRSLAGSPRWSLAVNDIGLAPAELARDFSCTLGVTLTMEQAPATLHLLARASFDADQASRTAKLFYKRKRPFLLAQGATCQEKGEVENSYDYPSGHATRGWIWATLLAQLVPERSEQLKLRGQAFAESRVVCGVHSASAVEAGHNTALATLQALESQTAFRADREAARSEVQNLLLQPRSPAPDTAICSQEQAVIGQPIVSSR